MGQSSRYVWPNVLLGQRILLTMNSVQVFGIQLGVWESLGLLSGQAAADKKR